eukprot:SAG31_NODE_326_length_17664_cov_10.038543_12_plen_119_part_00
MLSMMLFCVRSLYADILRRRRASELERDLEASQSDELVSMISLLRSGKSLVSAHNWTVVYEISVMCAASCYLQIIVRIRTCAQAEIVIDIGGLRIYPVDWEQQSVCLFEDKRITQFLR